MNNEAINRSGIEYLTVSISSKILNDLVCSGSYVNAGQNK